MTTFDFVGPGELPDQPRRIICHWTAGAYRASEADRMHYHCLIEWLDEDRDGVPEISFTAGVPIANNMRQLQSGDPANSLDAPDGYAAHTRGFNSYSIGVTVCSMLSAVEDPFHAGPYPIRPQQTEALLAILTQMCAVYSLRPSEAELFTHEEAERVHGRRQRGKWDIRWLPTPESAVMGDAVGPFIRAEVVKRLGFAE